MDIESVEKRKSFCTHTTSLVQEYSETFLLWAIKCCWTSSATYSQKRLSPQEAARRTSLLDWPNWEHCCKETIFHRRGIAEADFDWRWDMIFQTEFLKIFVLYVQPQSHRAERQSGSGHLNLPYYENSTHLRFSAYFTFVCPNVEMLFSWPPTWSSLCSFYDFAYDFRTKQQQKKKLNFETIHTT